MTGAGMRSVLYAGDLCSLWRSASSSRRARSKSLLTVSTDKPHVSAILSRRVMFQLRERIRAAVPRVADIAKIE